MMKTSRVVVVCVAVALLSGAFSGAVTAQWVSCYLGARVHVGDDTPVLTAAQIQAVGDEGGIAVVAKDPASENYIVGFQPPYPGGPLRKNWSTSGVVLQQDRQSGYSGYRINTTYRQGGRTFDNIQAVFCGGHGIVFNPRDPWARGECPGWEGMKVNGRMDVDELWVGGRRIY